ncbi:hypothetical protein [Bittarella massiliensis (ex Durand et al. 2017)]|uniref:hypothetical protein n=1 Tax=Bittarella massiliensis (ex Durand et al. 2017) TaxID=1720313 RepID=UPI001AA1B2CC|nr:hypothetical protein [Bittarella massiliensis (ex Durand et al. 2017)]MBO1679740.1 hypothetical protein [Bittarella massiliensis (ex Durand et al. 2017)]
MNIRIREGGFRLRLPIPNRLAFSGLSARVFSRAARERGVELTAAQILTLFQAIRRYRKAHPGFTLVEVRTKDGGAVEIKL